MSERITVLSRGGGQKYQQFLKYVKIVSEVEHSVTIYLESREKRMAIK